MKNKLKQLTKAIPLLLVMVVLQVNAQKRFSPLAPAGPSDFNYTIANDLQVSDKILEFDLYLLDTDPLETFELASVQAGITFNAAILNGGTVTMSIVSGSSGLTAAQQPTSVVFTSPNIIKLAGKAPPGAGSGTIISQAAPGTRVCRLRMTNTVAFVAGAKAGLAFSFTQPPYPTKVNQYLASLNTGLTCSSVNCFSNAVNIYLNAWQGGVSADWAASGNWNPNAVPAASLNAFIPSLVSNMPVVNADPLTPALCANLTISAGASLTVAAGKALTVTGTLTNNAGTSGLVVESGGSLIQNSANVAATVKRDIAAWTTNVKGWHLLSSPVDAQPFQPAFVSNPPSTNEDFYLWDEPTGFWINSKLGAGAPYGFNSGAFGSNFVIGQGYLVAVGNFQTKVFTGNLNAGDQVKGCTNTPSNTLTGGWNLLGNPFSSTLIWNNGNWGLTNIDAFAKIWNESGASYSDIAANQIIPPMQGFMVYVNASTSGQITIPASARTHGTTAWYKATGNPFIKLVAHNPGEQTSQESVVTTDSQATPGYDSDFDSYFLDGYAPQFYSVAVGGVNLSTNTLPSIGSQTTIPFNFIKTGGMNYTIEATQLDNVPESVLLTDLKTGQTQNLVENPVYCFTSIDGDAPSRFLLSFGMVGLAEKTGISSGIYTYENNLCLVNPGQARLEVFNLTGQKILTREINSAGLYKTALQVPAAYYMVRLTTGNKVTVAKVFLQS
ncbi:MAG: T9SS type A sorting domain-containing protein [Bacteroidota bacterium]